MSSYFKHEADKDHKEKFLHDHKVEIIKQKVEHLAFPEKMKTWKQINVVNCRKN